MTTHIWVIDAFAGHLLWVVRSVGGARGKSLTPKDICMTYDMNSPNDIRHLKGEIAAVLSLSPDPFVKVIAASSAGMAAITTGLVRGNIAWFAEKDGRVNVSVVASGITA